MADTIRCIPACFESLWTGPGLTSVSVEAFKPVGTSYLCRILWTTARIVPTLAFLGSTTGAASRSSEVSVGESGGYYRGRRRTCGHRRGETVTSRPYAFRDHRLEGSAGFHDRQLSVHPDKDGSAVRCVFEAVTVVVKVKGEALTIWSIGSYGTRVDQCLPSLPRCKHNTRSRCRSPQRHVLQGAVRPIRSRRRSRASGGPWHQRRAVGCGEPAWVVVSSPGPTKAS